MAHGVMKKIMEGMGISMRGRMYKTGNDIHQEGRYFDEEDDVFFDQLGRTRRRVPDEWDSHSTTEALMWKYFGGSLMPADVSVRDGRDEQIVSMYNSGETYQAIAERFELSNVTIRRIIKREFSK